MTVVFVFGSNLAGRHGKGAAKEAKEKWGAKNGIGVGRVGNSYAIPTKDERLQTLPLEQIAPYVQDFLAHAGEHKDDLFIVTAIGTGLAGHYPSDIMELFRVVPENVYLSGKLSNEGYFNAIDFVYGSKFELMIDPDADEPEIADLRVCFSTHSVYGEPSKFVCEIVKPV